MPRAAKSSSTPSSPYLKETNPVHDNLKAMRKQITDNFHLNKGEVTRASYITLFIADKKEQAWTLKQLHAYREENGYLTSGLTDPMGNTRTQIAHWNVYAQEHNLYGSCNNPKCAHKAVYHAVCSLGKKRDNMYQVRASVHDKVFGGIETPVETPIDETTSEPTETLILDGLFTDQQIDELIASVMTEDDTTTAPVAPVAPQPMLSFEETMALLMSTTTDVVPQCGFVQSVNDTTIAFPSLEQSSFVDPLDEILAGL